MWILEDVSGTWYWLFTGDVKKRIPYVTDNERKRLHLVTPQFNVRTTHLISELISLRTRPSIMIYSRWLTSVLLLTLQNYLLRFSWTKEHRHWIVENKGRVFRDSYDFSSFRQTIESVWLLVVSIMMWDVSCCRLLMKFVPILTCVTYPGIFLYITCTPLHLPSLPVMMVSSRRSMQSSIVRGKHESSLRNTLSDSDTLFAPVLVRFRSVEHVGYIYFHSKQGRKATKTQGATKYKRISKRKNIINEREQ